MNRATKAVFEDPPSNDVTYVDLVRINRKMCAPKCHRSECEKSLLNGMFAYRLTYPDERVEYRCSIACVVADEGRVAVQPGPKPKPKPKPKQIGIYK